jgi:hypothetical protein
MLEQNVLMPTVVNLENLVFIVLLVGKAMEMSGKFIDMKLLLRL